MKKTRYVTEWKERPGRKVAFVIGDFLEPPVTDLFGIECFSTAEGAAASAVFREAVLLVSFGLDNYCYGQRYQSIDQVDRLGTRKERERDFLSLHEQEDYEVRRL